MQSLLFMEHMSYVWLLWNIYIVCQNRQNRVYKFSVLCFLLLWFTVWLSRSGPFCLSPPVTFFLFCPIYICFLDSHSITVYFWYFIFLHTTYFFLSSAFSPHSPHPSVVSLRVYVTWALWTWSVCLKPQRKCLWSWRNYTVTCWRWFSPAKKADCLRGSQSSSSRRCVCKKVP